MFVLIIDVLALPPKQNGWNASFEGKPVTIAAGIDCNPPARDYHS
jgi:hypothetical protein